jgi:hypothetical protein
MLPEAHEGCRIGAGLRGPERQLTIAAPNATICLKKIA